MFNKDEHEIKIINEENIELVGYFCHSNKKECVVAFCGFAGNCDKYFCEIANECQNNDMSFLFGNTQGSYVYKHLVKHDENGTKTKVLKGAFNEDFDKCINDIHMWLNFASNQGFEKIYLVGASIACNRIIKYLNEYKFSENIEKIVLLCPQNLRPQLDKEMIEEAKTLVKNWQGEQILTKKFFGYCEVCARTFLNMATNDNLDNLPYLENRNFNCLKNIKLPVKVIMGSIDQGIINHSKKSAEMLMNILQKNNGNLQYFIIKDANHNFKNKEHELAKKVIQMIRQ